MGLDFYDNHGFHDKKFWVQHCKWPNLFLKKIYVPMSNPNFILVLPFSDLFTMTKNLQKPLAWP